MKNIVLILLFFVFSVGSFNYANAQCAMCKSNVENSSKGKNKASASALNNGILMMVALPYAAVSVIGLVWYTNRKRKRTT